MKANPMKYAAKAWKKVDEEVARGYQQYLVKPWEENGRSRYSLAWAFSLTALESMFIYAGCRGPQYTVIPVLTTPLFSSDIIRNMDEPQFRDTTPDGTITASPTMYALRAIGNFMRMPALLFGVPYTLNGAINLISGYFSGNDLQVTEGLFDLTAGWTFLGLASSEYIKDRDPALLNKAPLPERTYEWAMKRLFPEAAPQPEVQPQPVPARD